MSVRAAIGRWVACSVLVAILALTTGCDGEEPQETVRDLTRSPTPAPTMVRTASPTATVTLSNLNCSILGTCSPTPTATARPLTATATPPPTQSVGPTRSPSPSPSSGSAPTGAQLRRTLLTDQEVGSGWGEVEAGALTQERNPAFFTEFVNLVADEYLAVEVHDAHNGTPEYLGLRVLTEITSQVTAAAPLTFGTRGVRYRYAVVRDGERQHGEMAAWQQGSVVIIMLIEGSRADVCLCDLARRQDEKVRTSGR